MLSKLKILHRSIKEHPVGQKNTLSVWKRVLRWQLGQKIFPANVVYDFVEGSKLYVEKGMSGATGNIYFGLNDFEEMCLLLHFLRKEDVFFDLGANVGVYSVLASVNAGAKSIAVEPVQATFDKLYLNIKINNAEDKIVPLLVGIADTAGELKFTNNFATENRVINDVNATNVTTVPVLTLDKLMNDYGIPSLIKMDIEGYESHALAGGKDLLATQDLKVIFIEVMGSALRYGIDNEKIISQLTSYGFRPYRYRPDSKEFVPITGSYPDNIIFMRDIEFVKARVNASAAFKILNYTV